MRDFWKICNIPDSTPDWKTETFKKEDTNPLPVGLKLADK
jgi:hypothetical protein